MAAFAALLVLSLACVPPPQRPAPRPREPVGGVSVSPLSIPDREFPAQHEAVQALALDRTGRWMAATGVHGKITVWDYMSGMLMWQADVGSGVLGAGFSGDGSALLTATESGAVSFRDAQSGKLLKSLDVHQKEIRGVEVSPDGRLLAFAGADDSITLCDGQTGAAIRTLRAHTGIIHALRFSVDGRILASGGADKSIRIWNVQSGELLQVMQDPEDAVTALAFWPDGTRLMSGIAHDAPFSHRGRYQIWDVSSAQRISESTPTYAVSAVAVRPDGRMVALAYRGDGNWWNLDLLRADESRALRRYVAHRNRITAITFTPDGRSVVSAGMDGAIRVWH